MPKPRTSNVIILRPGDLVLIDLDNTAFKFTKHMLKLWRAEFPDIPAPRLRALTNYDIGHDLSPEDQKRVRSLWHRPGFYRHLEPEPGVVDAVRELEEAEFEVMFCSAPTVECPGSTAHSHKIESVYEHFGAKHAEDCCLIKDKTRVDAEALIDDKPTITGRRAPTWRHVYYDRPWNRHRHMDTHGVSKEGRAVARLHRWADWRQVIQISSR